MVLITVISEIRNLHCKHYILYFHCCYNDSLHQHFEFLHVKLNYSRHNVGTVGWVFFQICAAWLQCTSSIFNKTDFAVLHSTSQLANSATHGLIVVIEVSLPGQLSIHLVAFWAYYSPKLHGLQTCISILSMGHCDFCS